ncbi:hypothetical protein CcCBS67573_g03052 [Chytriomyces confervae]|uniref:Alpha-mannosidase n=1 Tax=Chytriomyces confervae TaxID=246404 RepID=A0A507FHC3_9FUNG|nr:hypothetical protein CcCBS67573_g03052 [Chytriomyces confervae]
MNTSPPLTSNLNTLQKHRGITISRFDKFLERGPFENVNMRTVLWKHRMESPVSLSVFSVPDLRRIPFDEAMRGKFVPTKLGEEFGPSWSTHWFKVDITIPELLAGLPVSLYFNTDCEGMVWSTKGEPLQGLTGGDSHPNRSLTDDGDWHIDFPITESAVSGQKFSYYIEIGCNGRNGVANNNNLYFRLSTAELRVANEAGAGLFKYFDMLVQIVKGSHQDQQLNADAFYTANLIVNTFRVGDQVSVEKGLEIATKFFEDRKGSDNAARHEIIAIGNCHLDTAWLWPFDETKRKAGRSFATQLALMKKYPHYIFTASQAQQFEWVQQLYPTLFSEMQAFGKKGQFVPVGGTWVEMDTNMPTGEALCRQFLYGQRFFEKNFGERNKVFWLPDTFGYSAQLPQIAREAGISSFLTTKLSWNRINKFPHSTFKWTGLDGSTIISHLPPSDNIMSQGRIADVVDSVNRNRDKVYTKKSVVIFGNGDGGGGPLAPMLDRLKLIENLEGLPAKITYGTPNDFFEKLEKTSKDMVEWKGELYFEAHRGTYTTAGFVKKGNRRGEIFLRYSEYLHCLAAVSKPSSRVATKMNPSYYNLAYPKEELDRLWKLLLLCQFHDVLPGSSIGLVFEDAKVIYGDIERSCEKLIKVALDRLGAGFLCPPQKRASVFDIFSKKPEGRDSVCVFNTTSWPVNALIEISASSVRSMRATHQVTKIGTALVYVGTVEPHTSCIRIMSELDFNVDEVKLRHDDVGYTVENKHILVKVDVHGRITSLIHKSTGRETVAPSQLGNVFKIFEDIPKEFDAWDVEPYQLEKGWDAGSPLGLVSVEESGPLRVVLRVRHELSEKSWIQQRIIVNAVDEWIDFDTFVEWHENRIMLRVEFPVDVNSDVATYETQYGVIERPTHYNTSWDMAKFEVCGHRFADLSEYGFGVALLNDCKYGYSVKGNVMRLSLLRAPKDPFPDVDMGSHSFRYALYPHKGSFSASRVVEQAYQYNMPPITHEMSVPAGYTILESQQRHFSVDTPNLVIDAVKRVEDIAKVASVANEFVVRMYEAYGGRGVARFTSSFKISNANFCNILEDVGDVVQVDAEDGSLLIPFTPFKVISIRITI